MFPFTIKYSSKIQRTQINDRENIFGFIKKYISQREAKDIIICENVLTFKSSFFGERSKILSTIERGKFTVESLSITYQFFMYRLFTFAIIASLAFGLIFHSILMGVFLFTVIGGFNFIITLIRHKSMFKEIIKELEKKKLIYQ